MSELQKLKELFSSCLEVPIERVTPTLSQQDLKSWDSMGMVNLIAEVESVFGVSFEVEEIVKFKNFGAITEALARKGIKLL